MKSNDDIRKHLSEKFEDFEVQPQAESWEAICFALDLKDKLETYEAEPQEETWDEIKFATDLVKKFDDYEAQPQAESWDKIQLSTNLSAKFKAYEAQPTTQSWQVIKAAITPEKDRRIVFWPFAYRAGIAAGIALLLGFGWLIYSNNPEEINGVAVNKSTNDKADKPPKGVMSKEKITQNNIQTIPTSRVESGNKSGNLNGVIADKKSKIDVPKISPNSVTENTVNIANKTPKKKQSKGVFEDISANELALNDIQNTDNQPINAGITTIATNVSTEAASNNIISKVSLYLLNNKGFKQRNIRLPFGEIAFNNEIPIVEPEVRTKRKMVLTSSIMPLQTYQALTLLPQTTTYIQQVGSLNAIDAQRLGLQARVGVMQPLSNRFSTGVSLAYAGIRQAVSYEVNNGTYDVDLTDSQLTLVGVSEVVRQNKFLHTVGLKLDNSYLVLSKKNKIFVLGGAEAVRILNANQYAYYLNASVALAYPMKGGKTVWIEPTYRYSLSQSADVNNYLQIRPSNIGLNFRVNFM